MHGLDREAALAFEGAHVEFAGGIGEQEPQQLGADLGEEAVEQFH